MVQFLMRKISAQSKTRKVEAVLVSAKDSLLSEIIPHFKRRRYPLAHINWNVDNLFEPKLFLPATLLDVIEFHKP